MKLTPENAVSVMRYAWASAAAEFQMDRLGPYTDTDDEKRRWGIRDQTVLDIEVLPQYMDDDLFELFMAAEKLALDYYASKGDAERRIAHYRLMREKRTTQAAAKSTP